MCIFTQLYLPGNVVEMCNAHLCSLRRRRISPSAVVAVVVAAVVLAVVGERVM